MSALIKPESVPIRPNFHLFWQGVVAILPLAVAVIPWGIFLYKTE